MVIYFLLCLGLIVADLVIIWSKRLIHAAIALILGNSLLALLFFLLKAPYAGSVQLSVGAGVVSVLFILAISLTESTEASDYEE